MTVATFPWNGTGFGNHTCIDCGDRFTIHVRKDKQRCNGCAPKHNIKRISAAYHANKEKKREYDRKRRAEKGHLYREASRRHRERYPWKKNMETQKRRAHMLSVTPSWASVDAMEAIYKEAALRTAETGIKWVVDHIIPLRGKTVCGFHVENNLQIITAEENLKKSNRFD